MKSERFDGADNGVSGTALAASRTDARRSAQYSGLTVKNTTEERGISTVKSNSPPSVSTT